MAAKARGQAGQRGELCVVSIICEQGLDRRCQAAVLCAVGIWWCLLVAERGVEAHHRLLLLRRERAALEVRPEVVDPPQPAALAVPVQPCMPTPQTEFRNLILRPMHAHLFI